MLSQGRVQVKSDCARRARAYADIARVSVTAGGHPVNLALVGSQRDVVVSMLAAGWVPADPITFRTSMRIATASLLRRADANAPVSDLLLFGRKQDLALAPANINSGGPRGPPHAGRLTSPILTTMSLRYCKIIKSKKGAMATATLTSKGQITIPLKVRQKLGLDAGDRVEFVELVPGEFALKAATEDVRSLKGLIRRPGPPVSIAAMNAAIKRRGGRR